MAVSFQRLRSLAVLTICSLMESAHALTIADPTQLPVAEGQTPPLATPVVAGGQSYLDPITDVRVWRATSPNYPCSANTGERHHDYSDVTQISREWGNGYHTLLLRTCDAYHLTDFKRGEGFSNWRTLDAGANLASDLKFTFSNRPETPQIAYVLTGSDLVRYDTATDSVANIGNFPRTDWTSRPWLQNDTRDEWFVAIASDGATATAWNSVTNQTLTAPTFPGFDEPHLTGNGRWVLLDLGEASVDQMWDLQTNGTKAFAAPSGRIGHTAGTTDYFTSVDYDTGGGRVPYYRLNPATGEGIQILDGGSYGYHSVYHFSGSWDDQEAPANQEWVLMSTYFDNSGFLVKGVGFLKLDGSDKRLLAHTYGESNEYWQTPRATISVDGKLVMFDSDFRGSNGGDVYVVEVPIAQAGPMFNDFDGDGDVDGDDRLKWQGGFGGFSNGGALPRDGDANRNGRVDGHDFLLWQAAFNAIRPAVDTRPIPEPGTWWLAGIASLSAAALARVVHRGSPAILAGSM